VDLNILFIDFKGAYDIKYNAIWRALEELGFHQSCYDIKRIKNLEKMALNIFPNPFGILKRTYCTQLK
jgi:hypothetical protein